MTTVSNDYPKDCPEELQMYFIYQDRLFKCIICKRNMDLKKSHYSNLYRHINVMHNIVLCYKQDRDLSTDASIDSKEFLHVDKIVELCATTDLPISMFDNNSFKSFLQFWNSKLEVPTKYKITQRFGILHEALDRIILDLTAKMSYISLFLDIWTYGSFICIGLFANITTHEKRYTLLLDIKRTTSQTAKTIVDFIKTATIIFKIPREKIVSITTDNCRAMIKAMGLLDEMDSIENYLIWNDLMNELQTDTNNILISSLTNKTIIQNLLKDSSIESAIYNLFQKGEILHTGCFIHKLQLCVKNAIKKDEEISGIIELVFRNSKILQRVHFSFLSFRVKLMPTIRWNYLYHNLQSIILNKDELLIMNEDNLKKLDNEFINMLKHPKSMKQLIVILEQINTITLLLQKEDTVLSTFLNWYYDMQYKLGCLLEIESTKSTIKIFIKNFLELMDQHFGGFLEQNIDLIRLVRFLNIDLHRDMTLNEKNRIKEILKRKLFLDSKTKTTYTNYKKEIDVPAQEETCYDPENQEPFSSDIDDFASTFSKPSKHTPNMETTPKKSKNTNENIQELVYYDKIVNTDLEDKIFWDIYKDKLKILFTLKLYTESIGFANGTLERVCFHVQNTSSLEKEQINGRKPKRAD